MGEPHPMVEDMAKRTAKASRSALTTAHVTPLPGGGHRVGISDTTNPRQPMQHMVTTTGMGDANVVSRRSDLKSSKWGGSTPPSRRSDIIEHARKAAGGS
jgi:hypothetical protein